MSTPLRNPFEIGKTYTFKTYAPEILGVNVVNVTCTAIMNASMATTMGLMIEHYHERMKPHLPNGYNNNPYTMQYLQFERTDGTKTIFALDWINLNEVEVVRSNTIQIEVNNVSVSDMEVIRRALVINGYVNISMKLKE